MGSPYNISGCASQVFFRNKDCTEISALSLIAESLAHPQRAILSAFVQHAVDREVASQFFLDEVSRRGKLAVSEFLADWICLLNKVRPVACTDLEQSLRQKIWKRDGGQCCISKAGNEQQHDESLLLAYIVSPSFFRDSDMADNARYFVESRNLIPSIHVETFHVITLENKADGIASLPNAQLFEIHHRCAEALAWLEVFDYMKRNVNTLHKPSTRKSANPAMETLASKSFWNSWYFQAIPGVLRHVWVQTLTFFRGFVYKYLARISYRLYGSTGSERIFRLPFNLYLRVASSDWKPRHEAEAQSLRLVEKYTHIPAPKAIDTIQYSGSSFLLMTGIPGEMIGRRISIMTDEQLNSVASDLKRYIAELRQIPNKTGSGFQICNALGGGILDWRIGDSQRAELRFKDEEQFNKYLIKDLPLDEEAQKLVSKSHSVKHDIVFTHADLNLRNILVDDDGKMTGIVDWECAGWYPEYWEYTKAHFSARYTIRWTADVIDQNFLGYRDELRAEDMLSSMVPPW